MLIESLVTRSLLVFFLTLSLCLCGLGPARAQELTRVLTTEDVNCNERQLEGLLQRLNAAPEIYNTPELPNTVLVSPAYPAGFYDGLVATHQGFRLGLGEGPPTDYFEHYLAFNVLPDRTALFLNPGRVPLPQVSLNRVDGASNLVAPGGYFDLTLTLSPNAEGDAPLSINNFKVPQVGEAYNGFRSSSTKPGRGFLDNNLLSPCHQDFTDFDRHVFSVLQRISRAEASEFFLPDMEIAIFRGEDPNTYRINFYPIYEGLEVRGRVSTEVRITWTADGRLTRGEIRILPPCTAEGELRCSFLRDSSVFLFLIEPVFGGRTYYGATQSGGVYLSDTGPIEPRLLDFETLLAGTTWNEPVW